MNEHIEYLITAPPLKISHSTYSEWLSAAKSCQQQHTCSFKLIIMSINSCFISLNIKLRISVQREILYACYQTKAGFPIQNNTRDLKMTGIIIQNNTYCKDYSVAKKTSSMMSRRIGMTSRMRRSFVYQPTWNRISSCPNIRQKFR